MYLKKLEVSGFKSFADKTVLEFGLGISGIIGPNGCGKSNISDSIRWCLGEQRSKSMRSSNMQEVIFSGTQTRSAGGMAEVSLTFDNSQSILPVKYSEITVTRRLFRSGESEYFINRNQCRLKDIRDMFLDTGLGSDTYSVIEHGKVDLLVTARPENRRELFEEVAGVAKYKIRREETLRKLEKIDTDISRLSDILTIHKQQITALDAAAKKAKQYKKCQDNLAKYEIFYLVRSITFNKFEIEELKKELDPKVEDFRLNNALSVQVEAEIQKLRFSLGEMNEQYLNINKDLSEIKTQKSVAEQVIQHATQRETEIKSEQTILEEELVINRDKAVHMDEQLEQLNISDDSFKSGVKLLEAIYIEKEQQYNSLKVKFSELESKKNSIRIKVSEIESEKKRLLKLKEELAETKIRLNSDTVSLQKLITRLESVVGSTNQEIVKIEAELSAKNESFQSLKIKQEEVNKTILENSREIKTLNNDLSKYKDIFASNDARIITLREFDYQDPVRSSIRTVLSLGNVARGPVSSLIDLEENKYELIAAALGEKLNYLVCETLEKAEYAIKFLENNNLSRLSFVIVEKISDSYKNGNLGPPSGYFELVKYLRYEPCDEKVIRFICSDALVYGNRVYGNVVVQGGGKIFFEKPILVEEQIKKLNRESKEIRRNISDIQFKIEQIDKYQKNLLTEKEKLDFDIMKIKMQIDGEHVRIVEKRNDINVVIGEINRHKEEINCKNLESISFDERISVFETEISDYEKKENELYKELKTVENDIFLMRKEEEVVAPVMMEARINWNKKIAELENRNREQQYIVDNVANFRNRISHVQLKITENNKKISELFASRQKETARIQQLCEEESKKESGMQVFLADKQTVQTALDIKTNELRDLQNKANDLKIRINTMQIDIKNFEFQKSDSEKKLMDMYGKNYEEIKNDFGDNIKEVDDEEIKQIKKKIEFLGSVNLAAQEEYDALEQKYNSILVQQNDLLKSKEDLYEIIKKINRSTAENFEKTFSLVKENFRKLYVKLFGGGEANLILNKKNDLLESGIDIFAQPPGKKLQSISLCSGGEKALTAVALIFAFFMVKPSPFCILDEVDASLDDANVDRYNAMIREFSAKTQFLVVTHNKRTMEMADTLYGVTMEEYGISKIISVRISKQDNAQ